MSRNRSNPLGTKESGGLYSPSLLSKKKTTGYAVVVRDIAKLTIKNGLL